MTQPTPQNKGPHILSAGFRILFFLAAVWAALSMALWITSFAAAGAVLPVAVAAVDWHVHSLLFGFAPAVLGGFLLTAIPNWTGRPNLAGPPLAAVAMLWIIGRAAFWFADAFPLWMTISLDGSFLAVLLVFSARELLAAGNKKNLPVLGIIAIFLAGLVMFDLAALGQGYGADSAGFRLATAAILLLLSLIGGRIVPAFTRNWLVKQGSGNLPVMFNGFDKFVVALTGVTLAGWVFAPSGSLTGTLLLVPGVLHIVRVGRWQGVRTLRDPLVVMLHLAYLFVPTGFLLTGSGILAPEIFPPQAGLHAWLAGAMAAMMLAVMTRASLGHSGRPLRAGTGEVFLYAMLLIAAVTRLISPFFFVSWPLHVSATAWIFAFGGFALLYAPVLFGPAHRD